MSDHSKSTSTARFDPRLAYPVTVAARVVPIVAAARILLENAVPDGNGNVIINGEFFKLLWESFGSPDLDSRDAIFGEMGPVTGGALSPDEVSKLRVDSLTDDDFSYGDRPDVGD